MAVASASDLVEFLRDFRLVQASQLEKITLALQGRSVDVRTLAKELVKRGCLTTFQVDRILKGRGAELMLGEYLLLDQLGEGGMGQVFKARHQLLNRVVALKVIRPECLASPDVVQRFRREVEAVASLSHPNIIAAQDARQVGEKLLLVTEYVEGTDLQRLVENSGPLAVEQACEYIRQVALGLQHAAANGLIHRDIKPSNLQVTADGKVVKILDLGLARFQAGNPGEAAGLTKAHTVMGTPDYIAPEQIVDSRSVDCRADIYSLGCTLYFLLAGRPPFGAVVPWEEKLVCHKKVEPAAVEQVRPDVPPRVGAILRKMMAKRPEDRYVAAAAVADDLAPYCQTLGPAPAVFRSLISQPADRPEQGWTLSTGSVATPAPGLDTPAQLLMQPTMIANTPRPASPAPGQQTTVIAGQPSPARKGFWLLLAAGAVFGMVSLLVLVVLVLVGALLWPKPTSTTDPIAAAPPPSPPITTGPGPQKVKYVPKEQEIDGYRIKVVKCSLQGHELICKLTITNLLSDNNPDNKGKGGPGGRGSGRNGRWLTAGAGRTASVVFDNDVKTEERPESKRFDDRTGLQLSSAVSMPKDQPIDLILQFANVPDGVKRVKTLNCGLYSAEISEIKLRDIEIEQEADK